MSTLAQLRENAHSVLASLLIRIGRRHRLLRLVREEEARILARKLGLTVRSGPAAGLRLSPDASWGKSDLSNKILGLYEQPLHAIIAQFTPVRSVLCIGAADGYYGVGLVASRLAYSSICFEMSAKGRATIAATAALNKIFHKVRVLGKADQVTLNKIFISDQKAPELTIIDIEGGEYDLLCDNVLNLLSRSNVIVELHPHKVVDGQAAQDKLFAAARTYFDINVIDDCSRSLPSVPELAEMSDDCRWVICSEAREKQMQWLVLTPLKRTGSVR